uniref:ARAD1A16148p n=1 Tax=Blastobotrys adeninivorans TaxID=409370 RepID=A0A060T4D5_BLAAD
MNMWLIALLVGGCLGAYLGEYSDNGIVEVPIRHQRTKLRKRDGESVRGQTYGSYTIEFSVGTPSQQVQAIVDTGSSDLWLNTPQSEIVPNFDPSKSSTFELNGTEFHIQYGSGSAHGRWGADHVEVAGAVIEKQRFGVVSDKSAGEAVFGIGPVANEASDDKYANVPKALKDQGHIYHNAYSMFIDNLNESSGRVIFGGVDDAKYHPPLGIAVSTAKEAYVIDLTSLDVGGEKVTGEGTSLLLDSGTTFVYLPFEIADRIAEIFGAEFDDDGGVYTLTNKTDDHPDMSFSFPGGIKITVPSDEMIVRADEVLDEPKTEFVLGIIGTATAPYILGDTFMRSAYVVHDQDTMTVAMAQMKYTDESDIRAITKAIS